MPTKTEQSFADKMIAEGWEVHHNGFPDFLCVKDGKVIIVEVKSSSSEQLKPHQYQVLQLLNGTMVDAFLWSPGSDLTPVKNISRATMPNRQIALPIKVAKPNRKAQTQRWLEHLEKLKKVNSMNPKAKDFWREYKNL